LPFPFANLHLQSGVKEEIELLKLISATDLKLEKAKYYLRRMKETRNNPNYLDFVCELESFLMHARSVTNLPNSRQKDKKGQYIDSWFLEKEVQQRDAGKGPGFQAWYDQKVLELQKDSIMYFLHDERNIAVHYNGSEVHSTRQHALKMSFADYVSVANNVEMTTVYVDIPEDTNLLIQQLPSVPLVAGKPVQITIEHPEYVWFFNTDKITGDKEVISVCEHYVSTLESILEDCRKHGFL